MMTRSPRWNGIDDGEGTRRRKGFARVQPESRSEERRGPAEVGGGERRRVQGLGRRGFEGSRQTELWRREINDWRCRKVRREEADRAVRRALGGLGRLLPARRFGVTAIVDDR